MIIKRPFYVLAVHYLPWMDVVFTIERLSHLAKGMGIVVFPALNFNNACRRVFEIYESVMNMHCLKPSKDNMFTSSFSFSRKGHRTITGAKGRVMVYYYYPPNS